MHNKLQFWPHFKRAVKEIALILPEETEHSTEALITEGHPIRLDYVLRWLWQEAGRSSNPRGPEEGPSWEENILSSQGLMMN